MTDRKKLDFEMRGLFTAHCDTNFIILAEKLKAACQRIDEITEENKLMRAEIDFLKESELMASIKKEIEG